MTQQEAPSSLDTQPMTVLLPMNPNVNADMLRNGDHGEDMLLGPSPPEKVNFAELNQAHRVCDKWFQKWFRSRLDLEDTPSFSHLHDRRKEIGGTTTINQEGTDGQGIRQQPILLRFNVHCRHPC